MQHSNEQASSQMSHIIKKASRELVGSHKLIQYREREKRVMVERQRSEGQASGGSSPAKKSRGEATPLPSPLPSPPRPQQAMKALAQAQEAAEAAEAAAEALSSSEGGSEGDGEGEPPLTDEELLDSVLPSVHCEEGMGAYPPEGGAYEKKVDELAQVLNDLLPAEAVEPLRVVGEGRGSARQLEDRQVRGCVVVLCGVEGVCGMDGVEKTEKADRRSALDHNAPTNPSFLHTHAHPHRWPRSSSASGGSTGSWSGWSASGRAASWTSTP